MRSRVLTILIVASAIVSLAVPLTFAAADRYTFTHLAGGPGGIGYRDGTGAAARFYEPTGLGIDRQGNVYVSDRGNSRVVMLAAGATSQSVLPLSVQGEQSGIAVDGSANVYLVQDPDETGVLARQLLTIYDEFIIQEYVVCG